jgi:Uncharacterized protein, homolog of phage Mu protein gp30
MNTTLTFSAAAFPADQARAIVRLICREKRTTTFQRTRERLKNRFKRELVRVLKFAKHETLRKLHRYLYSHRSIQGQDEPPDNPAAMRITFNLDELWQDLIAMLSTEAPAILDIAASDTLSTVGFNEPWRLPTQDVLDFIARRQNLLSGVPDEIFNTIRSEISTGLNNREGIRDLSARITQAFDQIETDRAELIAETETAAAYSYASDKAARAAGVKFKQWIHGASKIPRPDHLAIDGLIVPIDEPYPVGSPPLMYPHDPDGSPEDVINCSCISIASSGEEQTE